MCQFCTSVATDTAEREDLISRREVSLNSLTEHKHQVNWERIPRQAQRHNTPNRLVNTFGISQKPLV